MLKKVVGSSTYFINISTSAYDSEIAIATAKKTMTYIEPSLVRLADDARRKKVLSKVSLVFYVLLH